MFETRVQRQPFDLSTEYARLESLRPAVGAIVSFTGLVRDSELRLEHYRAMADRQMAAMMAEARGRWPLLGAIAVHRHGLLAAGEPIVLVLAASAHRAPAFEAASFLMDWLKTRAPFWKRDGETWVEATAADDAAAARWLRS